MYSPNGYYAQPPPPPQNGGGYAAYSVAPQPPGSAGGYSANGGGSGHHSGSSTPTGGVALQHQQQQVHQQQHAQPQQQQQQQQFMFSSSPSPYGNQLQQMPHHQPPNSGASGPYFGLNHNGPSHMASPSYTSAPQYSAQLPLAGRHRVTTTLWEDEGTLCFQVDARGVCVARRHDNNMINGTKLLNVCGMSRGKRDGILKNEKERVVVKVGAMHLKGVWITFARGKQLAETNSIADILYPLFETNIQSFLYHPDNYPRTAAVMAAAQERHAQRQRAPGNSPGGQPASGAASTLPPPPPLLRANTTPNTNGAAPPSRSNEEDGGATWGHPPTSTTQHHNANAYNTNSPTQLYQQHPQHNQQQQQGGSPSGAPGYPLRPAPVDRRHSMPLTLANVHNHPGHAENPYGPPQPSPGAVPRRTSSGLKRSYDEPAESDGIAPPAPAPGMSYSGSNGGGAVMSASNSSGSVGYEGESPRVYKRARDSRGSGDDNASAEYSNESDASRARPLGSLSGASSGAMRSPAAHNWTPVSTPSLAQSSSGSYSSASGGSGDDDGTRGIAYAGGSGLDAYSLASMSAGDSKQGIVQAVPQYSRTDSI